MADQQQQQQENMNTADASNGTSLRDIPIADYNAGFGTKFVPRWPTKADYHDSKQAGNRFATPYLEVVDDRCFVTPVITSIGPIVSQYGMQLSTDNEKKKKKSVDDEQPQQKQQQQLLEAPSASSSKAAADPMDALAIYNTSDKQPKIIIRLPLEVNDWVSQEDIAPLVRYVQLTYDSFFAYMALPQNSMQLMKQPRFDPTEYYTREHAHPLHPPLTEVKGSTEMRPGRKSLALHIKVNSPAAVKEKMKKRNRLFFNKFQMSLSGLFTSPTGQIINMWKYFGVPGLVIDPEIRWGLCWAKIGACYLSHMCHGGVVDDPIPIDYQQARAARKVTPEKKSRMEQFRARTIARIDAAADAAATADIEEGEQGQEQQEGGEDPYDDEFGSNAQFNGRPYFDAAATAADAATATKPSGYHRRDPYSNGEEEDPTQTDDFASQLAADPLAV